MAICHVRAKSSRNGPTLDTNDFARVTRDSPAARRAATRQEFSPVLIVITALAAAGVLIYARFLLDPGNRGDLLPWLVVIAAEGVLVVHALFAMWTMLSATRDPRSYHYWATQERLYDPADPSIGRSLWTGAGSASRSSSPCTASRSRSCVARSRRRWPSAGRTAPGCWTTGAPPPCGRWPTTSAASTCAGWAAPAPRPATSTTRSPRRRVTSSSSSTPTSCRVRSSSRRCCPSSPTTTWRSCRPRRPTATCTP